MKAAILLVLGFFAVTISSCTASLPNQPTAAPTVVGLHVFFTSPHVSILVGQQLGLRAVSFDTDGGYRNVTGEAVWTSSDSATLTVVAPGALRAGRAGSVLITATYQGFAASLTAVVAAGTPALPYLELSPLADPRFIGGGGTVGAILRQGASGSLNVTTQAIWSTSDTRVATVSQGQVSAVGIGTVEITASYGGFTNSYRLSVQPR